MVRPPVLECIRHCSGTAKSLTLNRIYNRILHWVTLKLKSTVLYCIFVGQNGVREFCGKNNTFKC